MPISEELFSYIACPNDGEDLVLENNLIHCNLCKSNFKILKNDIFELVSKESFKMNSQSTRTSYEKYYSDLRRLGHPEIEKMRLWGLESKSPFVKSMIEKIKKLVNNMIVFDIGAGVGNYSIPLSNSAKLVFHCDLDLESINVAREKANQLSIDNIIFVRCDYLSLPFKNNSISCMTCIDVLERGREHDLKLLEQISSKTKDNGLAILDFHAKERTTISKAPDWDRRYSKEEISQILPKFNLELSKIYGMGYIPQNLGFSDVLYKAGNSLSKKFLPPARWLTTSKKKTN